MTTCYQLEASLAFEMPSSAEDAIFGSLTQGQLHQVALANPFECFRIRAIQTMMVDQAAQRVLVKIVFADPKSSVRLAALSCMDIDAQVVRRVALTDPSPLVRMKAAGMIDDPEFQRSVALWSTDHEVVGVA